METAKDKPQKDPEPIGGPVGEPGPRHDVVAKGSPVRCPFCHAEVRVYVDAWVVCRACLGRHHVACWDDQGKCSACGGASALRDALPARPTRSRAVWFVAACLVFSVLVGMAGLSVKLRSGPVAAPSPIERRSEASRPKAPIQSTARPDLSHVRVGQRYAYTLSAEGASPMEMVYEVLEVGDNRVNYTIQLRMDMGRGLVPVGDPSSTEWRYEVPSYPMTRIDMSHVETTRDTIVISGIEFDCMIINSGISTTWVPVTGDVPTFPPAVRSMTDGKVTMELTRISR